MNSSSFSFSESDSGRGFLLRRVKSMSNAMAAVCGTPAGAGSWCSERGALAVQLCCFAGGAVDRDATKARDAACRADGEGGPGKCGKWGWGGLSECCEAVSDAAGLWSSEQAVQSCVKTMNSGSPGPIVA